MEQIERRRGKRPDPAKVGDPKLYRVTVTLRVYVMAESPQNAKRWALTKSDLNGWDHPRTDVEHASVLRVQEDKWGDALPFTTKDEYNYDEKTCEELLEDDKDTDDGRKEEKCEPTCELVSGSRMACRVGDLVGDGLSHVDRYAQSEDREDADPGVEEDRDGADGREGRRSDVPLPGAAAEGPAPTQVKGRCYYCRSVVRAAVMQCPSCGKLACQECAKIR